MIEVELPDGSVAEFPDGTPNETIEQALRQQFSQQPPELLRRPELSPDQLQQQRQQQQAAEFQRLQQEQVQELGPVGRFLAGAGQSLYQTGRGISQLFGGMTPQEVDEAKRLDAALMSTPGGIAGNIAGNVGQIVGPGVAARALAAPAAVQGALLPTTYGASIGQGAVLGGIQPVGTEDSRLMNVGVGGIAGGLGQLVPRFLGGVVRGTGALVAPLTKEGQEQIAARAIRESALNPNFAIQGSAVPGVQRTLAEASADQGIAQLERTVASASPQTAARLDALRRSNNAARVEALEGIAGTVDDMAKAEKGRDKAALGLLSKAMASKKGIDTSRVEKLADNILTSRSGQRTVVSSAVNDVLGKIKAAQQNVAQQFANATGIPVEQVKGVKLGADTLYGVRQHIDDLMSGKVGGDAKAATAARRELQALKSAIDNAIIKEVPEFGSYLKAYKEGSIPINQMQLGREILDRATGNIRDPITGALKITPGRMGRVAENLDEAAAAGTGFKRARADKILTPEQRQTIDAINRDLSAESFAEAAGRVPGSPTAQYLAGQNILSQLVGPIGVPGAQSEVVQRLVATPLDRIFQLTGGSQRIQEALGEMLVNPAMAQRALAKLPSADRVMLERALAQYTAPASAAAAQ